MFLSFIFYNLTLKYFLLIGLVPVIVCLGDFTVRLCNLDKLNEGFWGNFSRGISSSIPKLYSVYFSFLSLTVFKIDLYHISVGVSCHL